METVHKTFAELQERVRNEHSRLLTVRDVRDVLAVSAYVVGNLIKDGHLEAFDIYANHLDVKHVNTKHNGLRITPESLIRFLDSKRLT